MLNGNFKVIGYVLFFDTNLMPLRQIQLLQTLQFFLFTAVYTVKIDRI